jgi:hypothetical protein
VQRTPTHLEWRVTAVVSKDSRKFAQDLQDSLNSCTADGYSLAQMFMRGRGSDMILVHQKVTVQPSSAPQEEGSECINGNRIN